MNFLLTSTSWSSWIVTHKSPLCHEHVVVVSLEREDGSTEFYGSTERSNLCRFVFNLQKPTLTWLLRAFFMNEKILTRFFYIHVWDRSMWWLSIYVNKLKTIFEWVIIKLRTSEHQHGSKKIDINTKRVQFYAWLMGKKINSCWYRRWVSLKFLIVFSRECEMQKREWNFIPH